MHCKNFIIFIANVSLVMAVCMQAESMPITKNQINCDKKVLIIWKIKNEIKVQQTDC